MMLYSWGIVGALFHLQKADSHNSFFEAYQKKIGSQPPIKSLDLNAATRNSRAIKNTPSSCYSVVLEVKGFQRTFEETKGLSHICDVHESAIKKTLNNNCVWQGCKWRLLISKKNIAVYIQFAKTTWTCQKAGGNLFFFVKTWDQNRTFG